MLSRYTFPRFTATLSTRSCMSLSVQTKAPGNLRRSLLFSTVWMTNDKLLVNDDKTEFPMIGTKQQLVKVNIDHILIGHRVIRPKGVVKNLGTQIDSTLSVNSHVINACSNAFYYLYNIRRIRKYLSRRFTETLIHAFVISRRLTACSMACQPTSLISYRGSTMLPLG